MHKLNLSHYYAQKPIKKSVNQIAQKTVKQRIQFKIYNALAKGTTSVAGLVEYGRNFSVKLGDEVTHPSITTRILYKGGIKCGDKVVPPHYLTTVCKTLSAVVVFYDYDLVYDETNRIYVTGKQVGPQFVVDTREKILCSNCLKEERNLEEQKIKVEEQKIKLEEEQRLESEKQRKMLREQQMALEIQEIKEAQKIRVEKLNSKSDPKRERPYDPQTTLYGNSPFPPQAPLRNPNDDIGQTVTGPREDYVKIGEGNFSSTIKPRHNTPTTTTGKHGSPHQPHKDRRSRDSDTPAGALPYKQLPSTSTSSSHYDLDNSGLWDRKDLSLYSKMRSEATAPTQNYSDNVAYIQPLNTIGSSSSYGDNGMEMTITQRPGQVEMTMTKRPEQMEMTITQRPEQMEMTMTKRPEQMEMTITQRPGQMGGQQY